VPYITNITQYFDQTVQNNPLCSAIIDKDNSLTIKELHNKSLCAAHLIINTVAKNTKNIIAIYLPKGINSVIWNIGILYSANAYMNIDVKNPKERTNNILQNITPSLIITSAEYKDRFIDSGIDILDIDAINNIHLSGDDIATIYKIRDSIIDIDPLCIINTSGSTGIPKGVILNHRSFIDFTEWSINAGLVKDKEVIGSLSPAVFDIYSFELCMIMAKSACMLIIPETLAAFPLRILELMQSHKVSFIFWVPTIMVNIANMNLLDEISLPDLKRVWFAGEVFPTSKCNYWRKCLPQSIFVNMYGPIEITLDCTYHVLNREYDAAEPIPIGKACHNTGILLLNDENKEAAIGEDAELCVLGTSLAMGYYNDTVKTAMVFVQNPCNTKYNELIYRTGDIVYINDHDEIVYKGRKDTLIKHQGYRIELSELEHIIVNTLQLVKNCAVLYNAPEKAITVFYEAAEKLNEKEMRSKISKNVPRYMIPMVYVHYRELPRNVNGKIDRQRLKNDSFPLPSLRLFSE